MHVAEIMQTNVKTATPDATFAEVARLLHDNSISSVVVMEGDRLAVIVTERDVVNMVAEGVDPREVSIGDRMTRDLDTVESRTDIAEAAEHMARLQIRHLPVVERGSVAGMAATQRPSDDIPKA